MRKYYIAALILVRPLIPFWIGFFAHGATVDPIDSAEISARFCTGREIGVHIPSISKNVNCEEESR